MQIIKQPDTGTLFHQTAKVWKNSDGELAVEVKHTEEAEAMLPGVSGMTLDAHRARQLYNAIGAEMGFDNPAKTRTSPKGAQAYKGNGKHKWEEVSNDPKGAGHTYRLRVPGGWLYRTVTTVENYTNEEPIPVAQSTVFVPVPDAVGYAV